MTVAAPRTDAAVVPLPRRPADGAPGTRARGSAAAVGYQRVLHQLVRRELRMLAGLCLWAPADDARRIRALTRHADLIGRVLLHHHAVERAALWPALLRALPAEGEGEPRAALEHWTGRTDRIDRMVGDLGTAARQWAVAATGTARTAFAQSCRALADAVDAHTAAEEQDLLPLLGSSLPPEEWNAIARSARCRLPARERLLVVGLALEDACAADRARLLGGIPRGTRLAWRLSGRRRYRAAVVRLRGAPPAG